MSKWIKWDGGECPVGANDAVSIEMRDGFFEAHCIAKDLRWGHSTEADSNWYYDIIAYRIAEPEKDMETTPEEEEAFNDIANAQQVGGTHYKDKAIQPWDYIASNNMGYLEGNVVKYVSRWKEKGGVQDLEKAMHYLTKLIEVNQ